MRLVTYRLEGRKTTAGRIEGDEVVRLPYPDVGALLTHHHWHELATVDGARIPYEASRVATLIPRPPKIWCVGMNYASHLAETNQPTPEYPTLFAKFAAALIGSCDPIYLPEVSDQVDWEVELAAVIGRGGRSVPPEDALEYVAGYTVTNDVSMRDWQRRTKQFLQGKTFGRSTPLGPELVTIDEAPEPADGLRLSCSVNGETVQSSKTDEMVFNVRTLVAYVSTIAPLEPGDVIATGTPAGIGALMKPPRFLQTGDLVECVIEGIGALRNRCVDKLPTDDTGSVGLTVDTDGEFDSIPRPWDQGA